MNGEMHKLEAFKFKRRNAQSKRQFKRKLNAEYLKQIIQVQYSARKVMQ